MEVEVTKENFEAEVLASSVPVLVDFWADWCMPCKMLGPVLEELAKEYSGRLKIAKIDVDSQSSLASEYEVVSIPTLLLFKDGGEVERHVGAAPKTTLIEIVTPYLS
ncbi:thioredoxin [Spirochaeta dissipatitropha]